MKGVFAVLLLAVAVVAFDPREKIPCAFELMTLTRFYSDGTELTSSIDAVYHDHDNLWRWDSEFKGIPGLFESHEWSVIWRPDDGVSYHRFTLDGKCLKNNGGKNMYPYPYDWVMSKLDNATWTESKVNYEGQKAILYQAVGTKAKKFKAVVNLYVLESGEIAAGNGTIEGSLIDLTFTITISKFSSHSAIPGATFVPEAPCPATTIPMDPTYDFKQYCYVKPTIPSGSSGAAFMKPSILFLLAALLVALLISF